MEFLATGALRLNEALKNVIYYCEYYRTWWIASLLKQAKQRN